MTHKDLIQVLSFLKNPIIEKFADWAKEIKYLFDNGVDPYIDSYWRKFNFSKTFLHRQNTNEFYDLYYPVKLTSKLRRIDSTSVNNFFSNSNFITVIGSAGSGKSMLTRHIFLNSIKERFKLPILIELRKLNEFEGKILDYLKYFFKVNKLDGGDKILIRILSEGDFLFLLDGYDEVASNDKSSFLNNLELFIDTYSNNFFLITSRPGANVELFPRFMNCQVTPYSASDISNFVDQQVKIWKEDTELAKRIKKSIFEQENKDYQNIMNTPLLLSMYILSYEHNPEIPKKKSTFYANVFSTLCIRHDSMSKQGWIREKKSKLDNDELREVLKIFCYITFFKSKFEYTYSELQNILSTVKSNVGKYDFNTELLIDDLVVALSILIKDGNSFSFPHRSLQEYFAAFFISDRSNDVKKEIYNDRLVNLVGGSLYDCSNFLTLCRELDEKAFLDFIVKHLENMYFSIQGNNLDKLISIEKIKTYLIGLDYRIKYYLRKESSGLIHNSGALKIVGNYTFIDGFMAIEWPSFSIPIEYEKIIKHLDEINEDSESEILDEVPFEISLENLFLIRKDLGIKEGKIESELERYYEVIKSKYIECKDQIKQLEQYDDISLNLI